MLFSILFIHFIFFKTVANPPRLKGGHDSGGFSKTQLVRTILLPVVLVIGTRCASTDLAEEASRRGPHLRTEPAMKFAESASNFQAKIQPSSPF